MARRVVKSRKQRTNEIGSRNTIKTGEKKPAAFAMKLRRECRINIRATSDQETLIRKAAQSRGQNLTDFILQTACDEAAVELAVTRQFILPPGKWKLFLEALDKPPVVKPQLQKLFAELSVLERAHATKE